MDDYLTLSENREFQRVYAKGRYYVSPVLVTYVLKTHRKCLRVGITASKKTGNAVKRNRSRRVIREALRPYVSSVRPGYDLVLVARAATPQSKSTEIAPVLARHLKLAGVLK